MPRRGIAASILLAALIAAAPPSRAAPSQAKAAPAIPPAQAIALAEDQRRWSDGELRRFLSDPTPAIRARALLAIGRLQDTLAVEAVAPLLRDAEAEVRREAAFALGQIGHRSSRPALEAALADADHDVRWLAIEALGKLGDKAATPKVVSFLGDASAHLRGAAAVALWRLADSTALEPLIARVRDPEAGVRWRVLYALEKIIAPSRVVLMAAYNLDDPDALCRAYAARTLGRQKSPRATAYLLQTLPDPDPSVVVNCIRALQQVADSTSARCGPDLARQLGHPHPYIRVAAATALGERFAWIAPDTLHRHAMEESLTIHLRDPDPATRAACGAALVARRGTRAIDKVAPLLGDSSIYVRVGALRALGQLRAHRAGDAWYTARLGPGTPLFERMTAAEVMGSRGQPRAAQALRAGLRDTSLLFVASCAGALAEMKDSSSVSALAAAFAERAGDADADARIAIRDALRDLAGRAFADSLERVHPPRNAPALTAAELAVPPDVKGAVLHTTKGDIEWSFAVNEAPQTVKNFARLAARGYFDGTAFHRVVPNFVIQDGDPTGTGSGGPGYTIRCEYNRLRYEPGMVGMALSGKDTGGSQWFINHSPQPHLDGRYTIFARVVRGMEVVHSIVQGDRLLKVDLIK